jgi:hypothetical protein
MPTFAKIEYSALKSRQKENFNFHKLAALLADYGFVSIRLSDDWQGADLIASHIDGAQFLKIQLKGRLVLDQKYKGKSIWIAFRKQSDWYLYPHDEALNWALDNKRLGKDPTLWEDGTGVWSFRSPPKDFLVWLSQYRLR